MSRYKFIQLIPSGASESDGTDGDPERIQDETCEKIPESLSTTRDGTYLESDDVDNMYEACPYCGTFFDVLQLVEHVTLCENRSSVKAVEISQEDDSPFLHEVGASDCMRETSASDRELCPKCRQEFPLLELLTHATECKQETQPSTRSDVESSREDISDLPTANGAAEDVENFVDDGSINNDNEDDNAEHAPIRETELCPKCRQEFPLFELLNHATECKLEEPLSTASDEVPPREDATDLLETVEEVESFDNINIEGSSDISDKSDDDDDDNDNDLMECHFCGIVLPVEVMREHYPKHLEKSSSEELSSTLEENEPERDSLTERTVSSLDSYHDCQEQCMYCLKMFAVSVLVEHACNCTGLDQSSSDANEFERCCYCLRTFPLNELVNHAQKCDQRFICQEDALDEVTANSQSETEEVLERCLYCFKDFPVSKLIHHSQSCDGDMSGPRERFQGFLPSVHDLSAFSSVAILNETQRAALQYVITCSAQDSKSVASDLHARVQRLGYSESDLKRTLQWVRSASPIIIHINLDKVLKFLVEDTHYRNRFETGTGELGGSTDMVARKSWEDRIFNNAYNSSSPSERVKYGVLNIVGDPRGVKKCSQYGDSFLQLKKVRLRTTFASMDTSGEAVKLSCCEHYENVLFAYTDQEITAIMDVATVKVPFHRSDCISHYKEVQIHGPVSLSENVECIVVNPRHQKESLTTKLLDRFVEQNKCNLIWMDPDDQPGAAPPPVGSLVGSLVEEGLVISSS
ncbi:hypothetical protein ACROYT_G011609 [Oculina patagonica]